MTHQTDTPTRQTDTVCTFNYRRRHIQISRIRVGTRIIYARIRSPQQSSRCDVSTPWVRYIAFKRKTGICLCTRMWRGHSSATSKVLSVLLSNLRGDLMSGGKRKEIRRASEEWKLEIAVWLRPYLLRFRTKISNCIRSELRVYHQ